MPHSGCCHRQILSDCRATPPQVHASSVNTGSEALLPSRQAALRLARLRIFRRPFSTSPSRAHPDRPARCAAVPWTVRYFNGTRNARFPPRPTVHPGSLHNRPECGPPCRHQRGPGPSQFISAHIKFPDQLRIPLLFDRRQRVLTRFPHPYLMDPGAQRSRHDRIRRRSRGLARNAG
jgi:hypothetical protein